MLDFESYSKAVVRVVIKGIPGFATAQSFHTRDSGAGINSCS
jgi:hypothetical protein